MKKFYHKKIQGLAIMLVGMLLAAGTANAVTYNLRAGETTKIMPDGASVTMWGFADDGTVPGSGIIMVPGPMIEVMAADPNLTINLVNTLPEPVSVVIPGQTTAMAPVFVTDASGRQRVRSLTQETLVGGAATYTWSNMKPGTYMYHSGTHMNLQVQMGLYGALKYDAGPGEAYPGVMYDSEAVLFYSEIDSGRHLAVWGGDLNATVDYHPDYFLINGMPFDPANPGASVQDAGNLGGTTLIRLLNAGLEVKVPTLLNGHFKIVAEDGNLYPYPRDKYTVKLVAGKTNDVLWNPAAEGDYAIIDHTMNLGDVNGAPSGQMAYLRVGATVPPVSDILTIIRTRYRDASVANRPNELRVWAKSSAQPAVQLTLPGYSNVVFSYVTTGAHTPYYRRYLGNVTAIPGTVTVNSSGGGTDTRSIPYTMPPSAQPDNIMVDEGATLLLTAAAGVLANDDIGGYILNNNALQAVMVNAPAHGDLVLNLDGSLSYVHDGSETTADIFSYKVQVINTSNNRVIVSGNTTTVAVTIAPVNDAPFAKWDFTVTTNDSSVIIPVLDNDTDADNLNADLTIGAIVSQGTLGNAIVSVDGRSLVYTPNGTVGTDALTYTATDGLAVSNVTTVTITVSLPGNNPPVAVKDIFPRLGIDPLITSASVNVSLDILANDTNDGGPATYPTVNVKILGKLAVDALGAPLPWVNGYPVKMTRNGGTALWDPISKMVIYTPRQAPAFVGSDNFGYRLEEDVMVGGVLTTLKSINMWDRINVQ